jgi:hypothetical protein
MTDEHVKIGFNLDPDDWHQTPVETLWAKRIAAGAVGGIFELDNTPFHAKGVSYRDAVRAKTVEGMLEFTGVVEHRGHSTYRIAFEAQTDAVLAQWKKLLDLGCTREWAPCQGLILYAVDVPPTADIDAIDVILGEGESQGLWNVERSHLGHPKYCKKQTSHPG